jgi:hypothetical protein
MYLIIDDYEGECIGSCETLEDAQARVKKEATGSRAGHTFYVALVVAESRQIREWLERG